MGIMRGPQKPTQPLSNPYQIPTKLFSNFCQILVKFILNACRILAKFFLAIDWPGPPWGSISQGLPGPHKLPQNQTRAIGSQGAAMDSRNESQDWRGYRELPKADSPESHHCPQLIPTQSHHCLKLIPTKAITASGKAPRHRGGELGWASS
jgi:hypothetical protein